MDKRVRILLYVLSVILVIVVGISIVHKASTESEPTVAQSEGEEVTSTETTSTQTPDTSKQEEAPEVVPEVVPEVIPEEVTTERSTTASGDTTLIFTGDVLFNTLFCSNYDEKGISGVLSDELLSTMQQADITMVNEEFPFSTRGTQAEDKQYTFRTNPTYVKAMNEMGIDIVGLANNHVLDFGVDALQDTITTLDDAGILHAGAGMNVDEASALQTLYVGGKTFGFLAASRVVPVTDWKATAGNPGVFETYDYTALVNAIESAKDKCDYLTVFVHWGVEKSSTPEDYQTDMAHRYIDAGADIVVGAHPHVLQGIEYYNGKPIFYSLGNFIFNTSIERTMALEVTVDATDNASIRLIPASETNGYTSAMDETNAGALYDYVEQLSSGITVDDTGVVQAVQ